MGPRVDDAHVAEQVEIAAKYAGYLDRQNDEIDRQRRHEATIIPTHFEYARVRGLSAEALQKLQRVKPETIGQAMRIAGMTPAAISLLLVHLKRRHAA
jgi:tRNA uridine 5-carboxymethylaminomethyl modification enzyme